MNQSSSHRSLLEYGFHSTFQRTFSPYAALGLSPGRVAVEHRGAYVLFTERGEVIAEPSGRLEHDAASREDLPAVGDWVAFRGGGGGGRGTIHAVLPRRSAFVRGAAGGATEPQVVAANVDVVLLVCALAGDFNARRLERYLTVVHTSGADAAIVLTKADLEADVDARAAEVAAIAPGIAVHAVSNVTGAGLDAVAAYFSDHRTVALLGSSGAGKSTLVNRLAGAALQDVADLGVDGRGRHTTTRRELIVLPSGGLVLDTPGMRELRLWDEGGGLDDTFADVSDVATRCRFRDCAHEGEPGCAIESALAVGELTAARWESYAKLRRELHVLALRKDARAAADARRSTKSVARALRERIRAKRGR